MKQSLSRETIKKDTQRKIRLPNTAARNLRRPRYARTLFQAARNSSQTACRLCERSDPGPVSSLHQVLRSQPGASNAGDILASEELRSIGLSNAASRTKSDIGKRSRNSVQ